MAADAVCGIVSSGQVSFAGPYAHSWYICLHVDDLPPDGGNRRRIGIWYGVVVLPVAGMILEYGPGICNRLPEKLIIGQAIEALAQPPIRVFEHGRQQRYP